MDEFSAGENTWTERLGNLRNTVRQELIGRHLDDHVQDGASVVDVGAVRDSGNPAGPPRVQRHRSRSLSAPARAVRGRR